MTDRLTRWEGRNPDGTPRAVLAKREGLFAEILQEALRKLAKFEDEEECTMSNEAILLMAISTYGADAQEKMLLEEMSELQKEICKHWRGDDNAREIAEEIADVEIMLEQMKMIFHCSDAVALYRVQKLKRLERRLAE